MVFHCAKKKLCQLKLGYLEDREGCPRDPCPGLAAVLEKCWPSGENSEQQSEGEQSISCKTRCEKKVNQTLAPCFPQSLSNFLIFPISHLFEQSNYFLFCSPFYENF